MVNPNDFDAWNKEKQQVDKNQKPQNFFYHEREIWWCAIGLNIGVETNGKQASFERPILIVHKFNQHKFWGVPLTSKEKEGEFYVHVKSSKIASHAMISQLRTWSNKRLLRKIGMIPEDNFNQIVGRLTALLDTNRPRREAGSRRPKP